MVSIKDIEKVEKENEGQTFNEPQNINSCEKNFQDLIDKYEIKYCYHNKEGEYTGYPMYQGYVNIGWHKLLDQLFKDLIDVGWDRKCAQIKEKFGGLRVYLGEETQEMSDLVSKAEIEASKTCEDCGSKKSVKAKSPTGWIMTLCSKCWKEIENRRKKNV